MFQKNVFWVLILVYFHYLLQAELKNPERFIGIHFFNPAPLMPLVEVIPGLLTENNLAQEIVDL